LSSLFTDLLTARTDMETTKTKKERNKQTNKQTQDQNHDKGEKIQLIYLKQKIRPNLHKILGSVTWGVARMVYEFAVVYKVPQ